MNAPELAKTQKEGRSKEKRYAADQQREEGRVSSSPRTMLARRDRKAPAREGGRYTG